jgi:DNA ligase (NAD+)
MDVNGLVKLSSLSQSKFISSLKKNDIGTLKEIKEYLDDKYYNTGDTCEFTDNQYDILKDFISESDKKIINIVGSKIREDNNRVKLPLWLGSIDKIKMDDSTKLFNWITKNRTDNYVIADKYDGVSGLLVLKDNTSSLYTRGDGIVGANINHILKYIKNIPNLDNINQNISIRGELIIQKNIFEKFYSDKFANPRNMISGIINSKSYKDGLKHVEFIAYEVIVENEYQIKLSEQLKQLKNLGFVCSRSLSVNDLSIEILTETLITFLNKNLYEIDGIVIHSDKEYVRNIKDNPKYAFAFKMTLSDNLIEAEVEQVEWNISKHKLLKPRIKIKPVNLNGVTITYASAFNAKYVNTNNIGKGTIIKLTRSGDVIPFILEVIKPSAKPDMPLIKYKWNESKVDIIVEDDDENISDIKRIAYFFDSMNIKNVGESTVDKIYNSGYDTLYKIFDASIKDFENINGFGKTLAQKVYENIHTGLKNIYIYNILGSYSIFGEGIGKRKLKTLFDDFPDILDSKLSKTELLKKMNEIEGFSDITSEKIINNLENAKEFLKSVDKYVTYNTKLKETKSNTLNDKTILFSGFRNSELEKQITLNGGKIVTSISKKLSILIVKDKNPEKKSSKIEKAEDFKIPILYEDEFIKEYLV